MSDNNTWVEKLTNDPESNNTHYYEAAKEHLDDNHPLLITLGITAKRHPFLLLKDIQIQPNNFNEDFKELEAKIQRLIDKFNSDYFPIQVIGISPYYNGMECYDEEKGGSIQLNVGDYPF